MFSMRIIFHPSRVTHFESPNTNSNHDPLIAVVCHYLSSKTNTVNIQSHSSRNLTSIAPQTGISQKSFRIKAMEIYLIEIYCEEAFSSDWLCQLLGWHIF